MEGHCAELMRRPVDILNQFDPSSPSRHWRISSVGGRESNLTFCAKMGIDMDILAKQAEHHFRHHFSRYRSPSHQKDPRTSCCKALCEQQTEPEDNV